MHNSRCIFTLGLLLFLQLAVRHGSTAILHGRPTGGATSRDNVNVICCIPDEFETRLWGEQEASIVGQLVYSNGSIYAAYSRTEGKAYYEYRLAAGTPGTGPIATNSTEYDDYTAGVTYSVDPDGTCRQTQLGHDMPRQCIPADAKLVSRSSFGDSNMQADTYYFVNTLGDNTTATVYVDDSPSFPECLPIQVTMTLDAPPGGTMTNLVVVDIGPIKSKDVFRIPDACK